MKQHALLKILPANALILGLVMPDVDFATVDLAALKTLTQSMFETMRLNRGIGLSANQVAVELRLFVMTAQDGTELVCCNPQLTHHEPLEADTEGCLSSPGLYLEIKRAASVRLKALDVTGEEYEVDLYGIDARVAAHENEHLLGVDFSDKVSKLRLDMAKKRAQKLLKQR